MEWLDRRLESLTSSKIYAVLADHQRHEDWAFREQAACLVTWTRRFNGEFKLQITEIALHIEKLPIHIYSHFREGHNGFGLRGEITLNSVHFAQRPLGLILGDLLCELLHAWQHEHGRSASRGRCNREYRLKAADVGLIVSEHGSVQLKREGSFAQLLQSCGISLPWPSRTEEEGTAEALLLSAARPSRPAGSSKLKKWVCSCPRPTIVRVAIGDFQALCLKCHMRFRLEGSTAFSEGEADV
jgi:hypothetical protein